VPITVTLIEDDVEASQALRELLSREPKLRLLSCCASAEEALSVIPAAPPDVLLVDINLPGMSGIECVSILTAQRPGLRVLMLTTYEEADLIFDSLRAGASGYLLKKRVPEELVQAVEDVHQGGAPMSMQVARKVVDYFQRPRPASVGIETLTAREEEILGRLAKGAFDKEIADQLGISIHTVRTHLRHIYEKLHVQSRTEAVVKFLEQGPRASRPRGDG
jgi:DNA-binding NarL/FixJ family response regulator